MTFFGSQSAYVLSRHQLLDSSETRKRVRIRVVIASYPTADFPRPQTSLLHKTWLMLMVNVLVCSSCSDSVWYDRWRCAVYNQVAWSEEVHQNVDMSCIAPLRHDLEIQTQRHSTVDLMTLWRYSMKTHSAILRATAQGGWKTTNWNSTWNWYEFLILCSFDVGQDSETIVINVIIIQLVTLSHRGLYLPTWGTMVQPRRRPDIHFTLDSWISKPNGSLIDFMTEAFPG